MDAVTYPDPRTAEFLRRYMIAFRADANRSQDFFMRFRVQYTPTEIILDGDGREQHRSVGFLPPQEFIPQMMLGIAKSMYAKNNLSQSLAMLQRLLSEFPAATAAAEAQSLRKVCIERRGGAT